MPSSGSTGPVRDYDDFLRLNDAEREERTSVLRALHLSRVDAITVEAAAADIGIDMTAVRRWASGALRTSPTGALAPTRRDDLFRLRPIAVEGELDFVGVHGSREAEEADRICRIQWDYITGLASDQDLKALPATFGGSQVVRDPRELDRLGRQGEFDIPELYRDIVG